MTSTTLLLFLATGCGWFGFGKDDTGDTGPLLDDTGDSTADTDDSAADTGDTALAGVDNDGDGFSEADGDCDDGDDSSFPGAHEGCDSADNDCDGEVDEACYDCDLNVAIDGTQAYYSIQAAVFDAAEGQTVCVEPGTYVEDSIDNQNLSISLVGVAGAGETIIRNADGDDPVLYYHSSTGEVLVQGLSLTGGETGLLASYAPGLITLRDLSIYGNVDYGDDPGAGISAYNAQLAVENVVVRNNWRDGVGGGIYVHDSGFDARNLLVIDNQAMNYGGGIVLYHSAARLENAVVAGNFAMYTAGGIDIGGGYGLVELVNVSVVGNSAGQFGGGVQVNASGDLPTFMNVDIAYNESPDGGAGLYVVSGTPGPGTLEHTNIHGNVGSPEVDNYSFVPGVWGNLSEDPLYESCCSGDALGWDLHLGIGSLLIDAGDEFTVDPDGLYSDIGAYGGTHGGAWDLDGDGYPLWYQPGPYDSTTYPDLGLDCDDLDDSVFPGAGC